MGHLKENLVRKGAISSTLVHFPTIKLSRISNLVLELLFLHHDDMLRQKFIG